MCCERILSLIQACNILAENDQSFWGKIVRDSQAVFCLKKGEIEVRLGGNIFCAVFWHGGQVCVRIRPEYMLRVYPGARMVLGAVQQKIPELGTTLEYLAQEYPHIRRRVLRYPQRRLQIVDRLFLRHAWFCAVDIPTDKDAFDLCALSPQGVCVPVLVRCYADNDLRLSGPGGVVERAARVRRWTTSSQAFMQLEELLAWNRALCTLQASRSKRFPEKVTWSTRCKILILDFDHAQRQGGLEALRRQLMQTSDQSLLAEDILTIGDPGNVRQKIFFTGNT